MALIVDSANRKGLSISELKIRAKEEAQSKRRAEAASRAVAQSPPVGNSKTPTMSSDPSTIPGENARKDSSPVKVGNKRDNDGRPISSSSPNQPLSSILNIPRLLSTPHTAAQVSALWTAYHASRSGGTGRGYICAAIPLELHEKMTAVSRKYSSFVVPLPRVRSGPLIEGEEDKAWEFYFLQWDFHEAPPVPTATEDPFSPPQKTAASSTNPRTATVLFTPLQEYKMRGEFATPYLVLTFYTDLVSSHGTVLMRGEITPSTAGDVASAGNAAKSEGRFMLGQEDAQLLAMEVQKFYLWREGKAEGKEREGEQLLKVFHEKPEEFSWEELLKHAKLSL